MAERIVTVGTVTIHIPIRTPEQEQRYRERLRRAIIRAWSAMPPEKQQMLIKQVMDKPATPTGLQAHKTGEISKQEEF